MFEIPGTKKELFPYRYYTLDNINNPGVISKIGRQEIPAWSKAKYESFVANIDAIEGCRIDSNTFNQRLYAEFHCHQDVKIMRLAFNQFRSDCTAQYGIDPLSKLTICLIGPCSISEKGLHSKW
jgi:hypothetical protein